jgi:RHS repeat-associated protein
MELLRYFYHPDHASTVLSTGLDSSSWITDGSGNAIQHLHYLPFGEDWVDQRNSSWNAPNTFSGKEKDAETGYARYYDSGLSIWLSVDPMSDKYPNMSPYNYYANNPVILVDPDGEEIEGFSVDKNGQVQIDQNKASKDAIELYSAMSKTETGAQAFVDMVNSETKINVTITDEIIEGEDGKIHGKTTPKRDENDQIVETKNGLYKEVDMLISTADLTEPDRFTGASREEKLNAIGTHERVHLSKKQIRRDDFEPKTKRWQEQLPLIYEFKTRLEYRSKYGTTTQVDFTKNYQKILYKRNFNKVINGQF